MFSSTLENFSRSHYFSVKNRMFSERINTSSCPRCDSEKVVRNGSIHNGKPKFSCKECSRQLAENPSSKIIPKKTWEIVGKLLPEEISAAGISRAAGLSEAWIQQYVNKKYENIPKESGAVF